MNDLFGFVAYTKCVETIALSLVKFECNFCVTNYAKPMFSRFFPKFLENYQCIINIFNDNSTKMSFCLEALPTHLEIDKQTVLYNIPIQE